MAIAQHPGFADPIQDAQRTFRALLNAMANPGQVEVLACKMTAPEGLSAFCAAACLTLLDLETTLWLQPEVSPAIRDWLVFHSGCRLASETQAADFALILDVTEMPNLEQFRWGIPEEPEASTTLLIQLSHLTNGELKQLQGPGILGRRSISLDLPDSVWADWPLNHQSYPLGIDLYCFAGSHVMGLPRSVEVV